MQNERIIETEQELAEACEQLIADKIKSGEDVHMEWAVNEILQRQGRPEGKAAQFYYLAGWKMTYSAVKRAVGKYESNEPETDKQLRLHGYEHLQQAYTVERDGERVLVPIDDIPDEILMQRAEQFRTNAKGLDAHAREITEYLTQRGTKTA